MSDDNFPDYEGFLDRDSQAFGNQPLVLTRFSSADTSCNDTRAVLIAKLARNLADEHEMQIDPSGLYLRDKAHNRYLRYMPETIPEGMEVCIRLFTNDGSSEHFNDVERFISVDPIVKGSGAYLDKLQGQLFSKPGMFEKLLSRKKPAIVETEDWQEFDKAIIKQLKITPEAFKGRSDFLSGGYTHHRL